MEVCMSGWFNLALVILAVLCVGLLAIWQLGYDPIAHVVCVQQQDPYASLKLTGKTTGRYYCIHSYSDGGKACTSSIECEGDCMITEQTQVESDGYYGKKITGSGQCQQSDQPIIGCSQGTIENPTTFCQ